MRGTKINNEVVQGCRARISKCVVRTLVVNRDRCCF